MDLSRRNFLRLFSYASLTSIAPLEALCAVRDTVVTSDLFHFSLAVPHPWHVLPAQTYLEALTKNILHDGQRHDLSQVRLPIVSVTRHPEPRVEFNPGAIIQADRRQEWMGDDLLLFHAFCHENYLAYNRNSAENSPPVRTQFAGVAAASSSISYDHLTEDGASARAVCRAYSAFHRDSVFFLAFGSFAGPNQLDPVQILAPHVRFH